MPRSDGKRATKPKRANDDEGRGQGRTAHAEKASSVKAGAAGIPWAVGVAALVCIAATLLVSSGIIPHASRRDRRAELRNLEMPELIQVAADRGSLLSDGELNDA